MLCKPHYEKMIAKLSRFEETLNPYLFTKVCSLPVRAYVADKQYHTIPENVPYEEISEGWKWGGEGAYCWLRSEYKYPQSFQAEIFSLCREWAAMRLCSLLTAYPSVPSTRKSYTPLTVITTATFLKRMPPRGRKSILQLNTMRVTIITAVIPFREICVR